MRHLHLEATRLGHGNRFEVVCLETGTRITARGLYRAFAAMRLKIYGYAERPGKPIRWYRWRLLLWHLGWSKASIWERIPAPIGWR